MITQLKEWWKVVCKSVERIVYYVVAIIVLCVYLLIAWGNWQYYTGLQYKKDVTRDIYNNLKLYTGQPVPPLIFIDSPVINAWTDGQTITFTTGILEKLENKDQIANIVAHEMAHNMLSHVDALTAINLPQIDLEAHADKIGVYLMLRAGYDVCEGSKVWLMFRDIEDGEMADPGDHPGYSYRYYQEQMPWCE